MQSFNVYSPKVVASINPLPRVLRTRVLQFTMPKRKRSECIKGFKPDRLEEWAARLRDDLAIFALRNASVVSALYEGREKLLPDGGEGGLAAADDRLRDLLAPLFAVAAAIDIEARRRMATPELEAFAVDQAGLTESDAVGDYALGAHAISNWATSKWDVDGKLL
jgi:hypothetical protein